MPIHNVNLTDELDRFVLEKVGSGNFENAGEVIRAALRTLEREDRQQEAKVAVLRTAIDEGDASGIAEGNVFERVRKSLSFPIHGAKSWPYFAFHGVRKPICSVSAHTPYKRGGESQATRYLEDLEVCCQRLADNPP